jgi:hypothetical protein
LFSSELVVFIPGFAKNEEMDREQLDSLRNQTDQEFSILFVDPHRDPKRKELLGEFQRTSGIESFYFPYELDCHPRKWDEAIMNLPYFLLEKGRVFRYQQFRVPSQNLIEFVNSTKENIGFIRDIEVSGKIYPLEEDCSLTINDQFSNPDFTGPRSYSSVEYFKEKSCFVSEKQRSLPQLSPSASYGDHVIEVEEYLLMNGVDEALTATIRVDDLDLNYRWGTAIGEGLVSTFILAEEFLVYFGHDKRKPVINAEKSKRPPCPLCEEFSWISDQIGYRMATNIKGYEYLGYLNHFEWFKCKTCGIVIPRALASNQHIWETKTKKVIRASIGIEGYGRDLRVLREDVLNAETYEKKIDLINNSWNNARYY